MKEKNEFFETIKCEGGEAFNLTYHQKRISKTIGLNFDLREYVYPPNDSLLKCKLIYNEMEIISISYSPYIKREIKSFKLIFDDEIVYNKKRVNRHRIEKYFGKLDNIDEMMIFKNGLLTDTSIANIAIFDGTNWITPKIPLLEGTTRAKLLENDTIFERDITVEMLKKAEKLALLNAMIGMDIIRDYRFCL